MLWRILLALCVLVGIAEAQPVPPSWRPPSGCTSGQAIVFNGSIWTCGSAGITNSASANVIPKSDGTNLVASALSDDGTSFRMSHQFTILGSTDGSVHINGGTTGSINFLMGTDADADGWINRFGFGTSGTTRFRNLIIGDGKATEACKVTGSTKTLNCIGGLSTNGTLSVSSTATITGLLTATAGVTTPANLTTTGTGDLVSADDLTVGDDATISDQLTVSGNVRLGNSFSNRVGVGTAPDPNHLLTLAAGTGNKLAIYPVSSTQAYGIGIQNSEYQFYVPTSSEHFSFGTGDSDGFTEVARLGGDGALRIDGGLTVNGTANTIGDDDSDYLNVRGTLAVSGTDVSINSCGTGASVSGEAQSFQVTAGEGTATCTIDLNRTFNSAPYCTFSAANQTAAGYIATSTGPGAAPRISSTTTTVTLTFEQALGAGGGAAPIYNVSCLDRR